MNTNGQLYTSKTAMHQKMLGVALGEALEPIIASSVDGLHSYPLTETEFTNIFESSENYSAYKHILVYKYSNLNPEDSTASKSYVALLRLGGILQLFNLFIPTRKDGTPLFKIDVTRNIHKFRTLPDHISSNPTVAIVPNIDFDCTVDEDIKKSRYILDIFVSVDHVLKTLDNLIGGGATVDMFTFIDSLLQGIQDALGGINAFELQYYEEEAEFAVVDRDRIDQPTAPYPKFNIIGTGSVVKSINLVSKLSPSITSMLSISAQSDAYTGTEEATGFAFLNKGLIDKLFPEKGEKSLQSYKDKIKASSDSDTRVKVTREKLKDSIREVIGLVYAPDPDSGTLQFSMDDIPSLTTIIRNYYKLLIGAQNKPALTKIIPFELQMTLDGISGMRVMEAFTIDENILPYPYRTKADESTEVAFLITGLEHSISLTGWETKVKAQIFLSDRQATDVTENSMLKDYERPQNAGGGGGTGQCKTAYPDLPFTDPRPGTDKLPYSTAIQYLKTKHGDSLAKAVFAILFAEASKSDGKFNSAGGHNYAGVQTDNAKWGAPGIIGQYCRVDSGGVSRAFAIFESHETFLDFMANRVKAKGFSGDNGDSWVVTYINKWWSPAKKAEYSAKGSEKYNAKLAIYNSAIKRFNNVA